MIALVDCNNFFVSCERVFAPKLRGMPVVVLSSNDGCVVSRSNEAKELGVPMGVPHFQFRKFFEEHGVRVLSSNFALYSDLSARVMSVLSEMSDSVQVYSVDEAFIALDPKDPDGHGRRIREAVLRRTGIPVSVGIASTKVRAKAAAKVAKKGRGVFNLETHDGFPDSDAVLAGMAAGEIWGVGGATARFLGKHGAKTALDLKNAPEAWVRKTMGLSTLKIAMELRGVPTLSGRRSTDIKQSIRRSRSFGRPVLELRELEYAVARHADRAAREMREEGNAAAVVSVFIGTPRHSAAFPRYSNFESLKLPLPTSDTREIIGAAKSLLAKMFRPGYRYSRSGVVLSGFVPEEFVPRATLFGETGFEEKREVMSMMDALCAKYGDAALRPASAAAKETWGARSRMSSPPYTTSWSDLLRVRI